MLLLQANNVLLQKSVFEMRKPNWVAAVCKQQQTFFWIVRLQVFVQVFIKSICARLGRYFPRVAICRYPERGQAAVILGLEGLLIYCYTASTEWCYTDPSVTAVSPPFGLTRLSELCQDWVPAVTAECAAGTSAVLAK